MKEKIVLIGGGGHCHSVIDVIEQTNKYEIIGIVDTKENIGKKVLDYEIIACDDDLEELFKTCKKAVITIGHIKTNELRKKLFEKAKKIGFYFPTIISPLAYVSKYSFIDEGTVVMHHALVNANSKIGKNCIINTKALIEHDCIVEDNCHISTASIINGGVIVRENTFFGSNAMSKEYIEIGKNCLIGGGYESTFKSDEKFNSENFNKLGKNVKLFPTTIFINKNKISIGDYSHIDDFVFFNGGISSKIGKNVHISAFSSIIGGGELIMEDFSGLSAGCRIITGSDDFSGNSLTNLTIPKEYRNISIGKVKIGKHAILGSNVVVMPNVTIGEGCIVSAGSIVNKDLEPWSIYAGYNPKKIASRDRDKILKLEKDYKND
ncbi:NeuD/PglB/VioB family sugar acetyltransferase [Aliarcobacter cryaerophilus]|uniref:NeuD/PglB/VioB family sugar acetyltransferase n=1 Tax=Aliarcobacter cryaerophilus TaxID=28198 RepID=UPI0021B1F982|nr:NeuD/PglB/VioB family sugar acetyltransferase [Aliarcobacter cryaerophilus]MCT7463274.1 NeuD/PglB/VioB family sugar acetyltransferase [Aliarcobacter cryaerophilus]